MSASVQWFEYSLVLSFSGTGMRIGFLLRGLETNNLPALPYSVTPVIPQKVAQESSYPIYVHTISFMLYLKLWIPY